LSGKTGEIVKVNEPIAGGLDGEIGIVIHLLRFGIHAAQEFSLPGLGQGYPDRPAELVDRIGQPLHPGKVYSRNGVGVLIGG
jgi:hypothetical protein